MSIDPRLNFQVVNNFKDVKVSDLLLFLCKEYKLDISVIGNIIIIKQIESPKIPNRCEVKYDPQMQCLSLDIEDVELGLITQQITDITKYNVIPGNGLYDYKIKIYIQDLPIPEALKVVAYSNNLSLNSTDNGIYFFEKAPEKKNETIQQKTTTENSINSNNKKPNLSISVKSIGQDSLYVYAINTPIVDVIEEISVKSGNDYIMLSSPEGQITLHLSCVKYVDVLSAILSNTDHTLKKKGEIYIIGNKRSPDLMTQTFVQLQYRTVDSVVYLLPKDLIGNIEIKVFREQNSLMLSGPEEKVFETERIIQQIDRLVPVVSIEVMIIDYNSSYTISSGINAGISSEDLPPTSGQVFPSVDMNLSSQSINDLINRFNGFGWAKIGKVTPSFYTQIRALENQGVLKIRSTPILSTLNGHQTRLSIGTTEYYMEEQFNIIGTQNPQSTKIETYKSVDAELEVIITPIVSGDDQITLEVEVNQSDFTARISSKAPPGKVSRTFKSQIRVKNQEMILLGGLEENRTNQTRSGVPLLSRIPLLKWLFSNTTSEKSKSKLNVFIKPTIIS